MTLPIRTDPAETSFTRDLLHAARYYLANRRGLMIVAFVAVAGGLALNWSWLVAAGIAPILFSVLPCLAMCAVGVCCMKKAARPDRDDGAASDKGSEGPGGSD